MEEGYIEVSVIGTSETVEALADFLFSEGALGLVIEDPPERQFEFVMRASFPAALPIEAVATRLARYQHELRSLGLTGAVGRIETRHIPFEDWGKTWKEHFRPFAVGKHLVIAPPWEDASIPEDRLLIRIDPGMSFGTGHHATTRMCLEALEACMGQPAEIRGRRVLDVGTGTGILAIAAVVLGAECVVAIDTDPDACEAATRNLVLNRVSDQIRLCQGGVDALGPELPFDVIVANLDAKSLCALFGDLSTLLHPRGQLVASGILVEEEATVVAAARAARLGASTRQSDGEWLCLTLAAGRSGSSGVD